jgi:tetratricopeptide (TPR) repeat protein
MQKDKYSSYDSLSSGGMPRIFWIIVGVATALAIFIVLFLLLRGFQDGQRQSEAQRRQQIAIYLQNGQDATSDGDQQSALDAYRRVLILDPENEEAIAGIGNLLNGRAVQPSPTVAVLAAPTPDAPVSTPTAPNPLAVTWVDAQNLYNAGRWEEAIVRLRQVRLVDADFERARVEEMLFTAYVSLGTEKSNGGSL